MKYFKYLFLFLLAAMMLPSCADEGPEALGTIDCKAKLISATPNTLVIEISYKTSSLLERIPNIEISRADNDEYVCQCWDIVSSTPNSCVFKASDLEPATEYKISAQVVYNLKQAEYGWDDYDEYYVQPTGDYIVSTRPEGDYSDITHAHGDIMGVTNTSATFRVCLDEQELSFYRNENLLRLKYGTSPDLSGSDTKEVILEPRTYGTVIQEGVQYSGVEEWAGFCIANLKPDTKYYYSLTADFNYAGTQIVNLTLDISDNTFTTEKAQSCTSQFTLYDKDVYSDGARLYMRILEPYLVASKSWDYTIDVVCSTSSDFSNPTVFSFTPSSYAGNDLTVNLSGLAYNTKYYFYLVATLVDINDEWLGASSDSALGLLYQDVKIEGVDGCGTFTTGSSYY